MQHWLNPKYLKLNAIASDKSAKIYDAVQEYSVMNEDAIVNKNGSSKLVELIVIQKLAVSGKS